jgi:hypothetical protein
MIKELPDNWRRTPGDESFESRRRKWCRAWYIRMAQTTGIVPAPDAEHGVEELMHHGRGGEIRTHDPLYPKQVRYQAAPHPDRALLTLVAPQQLRKRTRADLSGFFLVF